MPPPKVAMHLLSPNQVAAHHLQYISLSDHWLLDDSCLEVWHAIAVGSKIPRPMLSMMSYVSSKGDPIMLFLFFFFFLLAMYMLLKYSYIFSFKLF